jgi:hypothetical protein
MPDAAELKKQYDDFIQKAKQQLAAVDLDSLATTVQALALDGPGAGNQLDDAHGNLTASASRLNHAGNFCASALKVLVALRAEVKPPKK